MTPPAKSDYTVYNGNGLISVKGAIMKKFFRSIISALTASVMCFAFAACGNDAPPDSPDDTDKPSDGGSSVPVTDEIRQKALAGVEKLLTSNSFTGEATFTGSSDKKEDKTYRFDYDKRGLAVKATSVGADSREYILDISTGYAYEKTGEGYKAFQVMPAGTVEYFDYLVSAADGGSAAPAAATDIGGTGNAALLPFLPTGSYDESADKLTYVWNGAAEINKYIEPLNNGYKLNKTVKATLNDYFKLFSGGQMTFEMLYDSLFAVVGTNSEFTVEEFNQMLEPYGIDIYEIIEKAIGPLAPEIKAAVNARKVGEIVSGVYDYVSRITTGAQPSTPAEKITLDGLVNAAFFAETEYTAQKLEQIKALCDLALMTQMRAVVNTYIAAYSPELAEIIKNNVELTEFGYEFSLVFDDSDNISEIYLKTSLSHSYAGEANVAFPFLSDNGYCCELKISVTEYSDVYDRFVYEVTDVSYARPIFAVACGSYRDAYSVKIESVAPLSVDSVSASYGTTEDGFAVNAIAEGKVVYNAQTGELEIDPSVFAAIQSTAGGQCAVIDIALNCGTDTVNIVVAYLDSDPTGVSEVLTELAKRYLPDISA